MTHFKHVDQNLYGSLNSNLLHNESENVLCIV
uniref:Uncharacterized protein n=1 Tax=Rhizophora mucronata TaxID=61149 RepID=A0A2P2N6P8_RHIMU